MDIIFTCPRLCHSLPFLKRAQIVKYLQLRWRPDAIAKELNITTWTVYNAKSNMARYGSIVKPLYTQLRRLFKFIETDKKAILELLLQKG